MEIKEYLEQSELGSYKKVFPELIIPTLGNDADGYLRTIAACAIEQVKFLNSYAGVPLEVLYENVGQRHKASNLSLLAMLRKTGNAGDGLGLITLPGESEGAYSAYYAGAVSADIWTAQNNLIEQQSAYLDDIQDTFTTMREELKVGFTMKQFTESNAFKFLADLAVKKVTDWLTDAWPGLADDAILDTVSKYAPKAIGWGLVWLHKQLLAGSNLCIRMKEENLQILKFAQTLDLYKLRSEVISQHDLSIQSLLSQVALVESQLKESDAGLADILNGSLYATYDPAYGFKKNAGLAEQINRALFFKDTEKLNEDIGLATLVKEFIDKQTETPEPVIQCPHTGDFIFAHSRGKMSKS